MNINIIGSGSSGNSILFGDSVLLDTGLPFSKVKEYTDNIKVVLLTHVHGDHFNSTTIRKLYIANNNIKFCCGEFLHQSLVDAGLPSENIVIIERGEWYRKDDFKFSPVSLYHDVHNFGYRIEQNGHKHFHCTDTAHLQGITAKNYDSGTIECNHEREHALKIIEESFVNGEFSHLKRTIDTHLSVDKAVNFVKENNIKVFYPVHMGRTTSDSVHKYLNDNGSDLDIRL